MLRAVGGAINSRRHKRGLSQAAVASHCRFDRAYLSTIEAGLRNPTLITLVCIASALGCPASEILADAGY
jgi:transcriptional regulator with XRE-family HTH domain